jgi:chondroitin AC lyase
LNQCALDGDVSVGSFGSDMVIPQGEHQLEKTEWIFHHGVGYLFPGLARVILSNQAQTGSWYKINRQTSSSRNEVSLDVFKLWIDHGVHASNAGYQYIVMPASTKEKVKNAIAHPNIDILHNTPTLQAVWHHELNILQAVFYTKGEITFADGIRVILDSPCILMIKKEGENIKEISVADPLRKLSRINLSINRKIQTDLVHSFWNDANRVSEISIDLPQTLFAGKSVTVHL